MTRDAHAKAPAAQARADNVAPIRAKRACPECGRPSARQTYPFCTARCKDVDLHRWLSGAYAIPVRDESEDDSRSGGQTEDT